MAAEFSINLVRVSGFFCLSLCVVEKSDYTTDFYKNEICMITHDGWHEHNNAMMTMVSGKATKQRE